MGVSNLPSPLSPPGEEHKATLARKNAASGATKTKSVNRVAKRPSLTTTSSSSLHHDHSAHSASSMDGRHKRVWKACERCRMKKTKCDGEFPCKRCKDDGLVCTAGVRKKIEYKQLPRGYAEVLENTQFALIATVHKLYSMVRNSQQWDLGEPELNERGQPVIHDIAQKLGCIRPNSDIDLPVHSVFPEDERGMAELARQLEEQQSQQQPIQQQQLHDTDSAKDSPYPRNERASSSDLDHSDFEQDYRAVAFGSGNAMTLSPQSFTTSNTDFELGPPPPEMDPTASMFPTQSPVSGFPAWSIPQAKHQQQPSPDSMTMAFFQQSNALQSMDLLNQGLMESDFGTIKPHIVSVPNPEVMMGMGDPMIYSGYDGEPMRL